MIEQDNYASFALAARLGFVAFAQQDYDGRLLTLLQRGEDPPK